MSKGYPGFALAVLTLPALPLLAANPMFGRAPMFAGRTIAENAVNSADHTMLAAAAMQAAGLVEALQGPGPFTVFAPVNAAFSALPQAPWTRC